MMGVAFRRVLPSFKLPNRKKKKWLHVIFFCILFQVAPSCYDDEALLINLTSLLDEMLHVVESAGLEQNDLLSQNVLLWFLQDCVLYSERNVQILGHGSPLLRVLESSEPQPEPVSSGNEAHVSSVSIRRQLCKGILCLLSRTARMLRFCGDKQVRF